ncbi:WYL domain-containing protein [Bradyrhizobium sp. UFLA01-814]|uniref:WYL domain-containing protein n=1 Tax=Bradyrhizobium sp. UFLA01-814 TaxID=3023480 RepID=UPI00398B03C6
MDIPGGKLRWGTEQRLEFIEFRLFWDGSIKRNDIAERFGVSAPQASNDLAQYRERAPGNMEYDPSAKRFVPSSTFRPRLMKPNAERYLAQMRAISENVIAWGDTWFGTLPDVGIVPVPERRVEPVTLKPLLRAVRERRSIMIEYQSLSDERPEPIWRGITPHAFATDGLRWHMRAFCHLQRVWKDFLISRCLTIGDMANPEADPQDDRNWREHFTVVLIPNPKLSKPQCAAIERDYGMKDGRSELDVRRAMLYYLDKRLRLDVGREKDRPKETPIIVANRKEYDAVLKDVKY